MEHLAVVFTSLTHFVLGVTCNAPQVPQPGGTCGDLSSSFGTAFANPFLTFCQVAAPVGAAIHALFKISSGQGEGARTLLFEIGILGGSAVLGIQFLKILAGV